MGFIKVYTEKTIEGKYPNSLANSVHMAVSDDGEEYQKLNQGYGILFAKADIREDNTLDERGIVNPGIVQKDGIYYISGEKVDAEGRNTDISNRAEYVCWKSVDLIEFEESYDIVRTNNLVCEISDELMDRVKKHWLAPECVEVRIPEKISVCGELEDALKKIKADVIYSDGSTYAHKINWRMDSVRKKDDGTFAISGNVIAQETGFPLTCGYADPVFYKRDGAWYFLATNDNVDDIGMFVRKADTIEALFGQTAKEYCILPYDEKRGFCQTFWAPEFHEIGGELYILFAVSDTTWGPQCHMMKLKKDGHIENEQDWENPIKVLKADDTPVGEGGITLDMTYFKTDKSYVCWSYRENIGTALDSGSMLYIATVDENKPWVLTSDPVLISRPLYGWENNSGTINNEGPYPLILDDKIYIAYSGGDACGYYYAVGYLIADTDANLLDKNNWKKLPMPVLHSLSVPGIAGPGHNSFFVDDDGTLMIAYHAQEREKTFNRCSAYHRVHISAEGFPLLNVAGERDVAANMREVELTFTR